MKIKIADKVFLVKNETSKIREYFKDFTCNGKEDFQLDYSECNGDFYDRLYELFNKIILTLLKHSDTLRIHSSAIKVGDRIIAFGAPSGTGKSTHASLWEKYCPEKVVYVNDDQPFYKIGKEDVTVYGSPLSGKENRFSNEYGKLKAFVILRQSKTNNIYQIEKKEAFKLLFKQVFLPKTVKESEKTLELLNLLVGIVPVFVLECDISEQAFKVCYDAVSSL